VLTVALCIADPWNVLSNAAWIGVVIRGSLGDCGKWNTRQRLSWSKQERKHTSFDVTKKSQE
jgi:hypothetical protein